MVWYLKALEVVAETVAELFLRHGKKDNESAKQIVQANYSDIVSICDSVLNKKMEPVSAFTNMKASLYQMDPKVLEMSLRVLQNVMEERGMPVATPQEDTTQFLDCMRQMLRTTSDEGVRESIFELNDTFKKACSTQPNLRGVGDLINTFNQEGYKVLVVKSNGDRPASNEISNDVLSCYMCDLLLRRDAQHHCKYCQNIFCDQCCTCQWEDRSYRPGRAAICICERCRNTDNGFLRSRSIEDRRDRGTVPKAVWSDPHQHSSGQRNQGQVVRYRGGNDREEEDGVQLNVVVPRDMADDPEGWAISIQCKKNENSPSQVNGPNRKGKCYRRMPSSDEGKKMYYEDSWEDKADSGYVVTAKSAMRMEEKDLGPSPRYSCDWREMDKANTDYVVATKSSMQREEKDLGTSPCYSYNRREMDTECRTCCECKREADYKPKPRESELSQEEQDLRLAMERSKQTVLEQEELQRALELSLRDSMNSKVQMGERLHTYEETEESEESEDTEEDNDAPLYDPRRRGSLRETKKTCSASAEDKKAWKEEEDIQRAIEQSMKISSKAQACVACTKDKLALMEEEQLQRAIELSKQEMSKSPRFGYFEASD